MQARIHEKKVQLGLVYFGWYIWELQKSGALSNYPSASSLKSNYLKYLVSVPKVPIHHPK